MENLIFKRVLPEEMDLWFSMRIDSLNESPSAFLASPQKELEQGVDFFRSRIIKGGDDNVIFGCLFEGKFIGSVGIVREGHEKASHKSFIWGMYVSPEFRKLKVAGKLLDMAINFAIESMKVSQINLSVESTREPAKRLYTSRGFEKWGTEKNAMQVGEQFYDEDYMVLVLN